MSDESSLPVNRLILGDNLEIMKTLESESVDLIYLDPPFFSNRNYEIIWGDAGEIRSFKDRWSGGIEHYIAWLKERVVLMHHLLKKTGSIFLHCDWHANSYIRVEILEKIFGRKNFRNEIIWCYNIGGKSKTDFANKHDTIYRYSKSGRYTFNAKEICIAMTPHKQDRSGKNYGGKMGVDENGRQYVDKQGTRDQDGNYKYYRYYLDEGKIPEDWWIDINAIQPSSTERIGYPTQKPEALLERIIKSASNEGDVVLDPFMGGGTTATVADKLKRRWIGIDQSTMAVKVTELRLDKQHVLFSAPFSVQLHKYDYDTLRYKDSFEFESWIIQQFGGAPRNKKGGDKGIDGKTAEGTPIQVKRSDNIGRNVIDNFLSASKRADKKLYAQNIKDKKPIGYIIAFSFGKGAVEEAARLKNQENVIIRLVRVDEIVPIAPKPTVTITMRELAKDTKGESTIEFSAEGHSESGIEFYTWDFNYDEEQGFKSFVMIDKIGKQTHTFKAGVHTIAVKAVDNEGLESIETIKLKVNGVVKKL